MALRGPRSDDGAAARQPLELPLYALLRSIVAFLAFYLSGLRAKRSSFLCGFGRPELGVLLVALLRALVASREKLGSPITHPLLPLWRTLKPTDSSIE